MPRALPVFLLSGAICLWLWLEKRGLAVASASSAAPFWAFAAAVEVDAGVLGSLARSPPPYC